MLKLALAALFVFHTAHAFADCDLTGPQVKEQVTAALKEKTDADLSKAFWFTMVKSNVYTTFIVQLRRLNKESKESEVQTMAIGVSCELGAPFIDSVMSWTTPLSGMPEA